MTFGVGSISDPYALGGNRTELFGFRDTTGKMLASAIGVPGEVTKCFIVGGDSMSGNCHQSAYTVVNPSKVLQINVFDGAVYRASDVLMGSGHFDAPNNRNWMIETSDLLIAAGFAHRVIFIPIGVGGAGVVEGAEHLYLSFRAAKNRAEALGLTVDAVLCQLGSNDSLTPLATWVTNANLMIDRAALGVPWLWAKTCYNTMEGVLANVAAGIDQIWTRADVFPGPDTNDLTGAYRSDIVHFNAAGCSANAARWKAAIVAAL